jgi:hypothetical protein
MHLPFDVYAIHLKTQKKVPGMAALQRQGDAHE